MFLNMTLTIKIVFRITNQLLAGVQRTLLPKGDENNIKREIYNSLLHFFPQNY